MEQCSKCKYWQAIDVDPKTQEMVGACHRWPPVDNFPVTQAREWCGEFKPA